MTNKQAYAGLLERLVAEATLLDQLASTLTKGKSQVSQAGDACREAAEAISSLLKRVEQAVNSLWAIKELANGLGETLIENEAERLLAALNSDAPLSIGEGDRG